MEKYRDVMEQAIELTKTMIEGTNHLQLLINEGRFEQSILLFEEVMQAYAAVERSVAKVIVEMERDELNGQLVKVRESLELVLSAYESKEYMRVNERLQFGLIPQLKKIEADFSEAFSMYLIS